MRHRAGRPIRTWVRRATTRMPWRMARSPVPARPMPSWSCSERMATRRSWSSSPGMRCCSGRWPPERSTLPCACSSFATPSGSRYSRYPCSRSMLPPQRRRCPASRPPTVRAIRTEFTEQKKMEPALDLLRPGVGARGRRSRAATTCPGPSESVSSTCSRAPWPPWRPMTRRHRPRPTSRPPRRTVGTPPPPVSSPPSTARTSRR